MPVATTAELTPDELSQAMVLRRVIQLMVQKLVQTGSGQYQKEVQDFQRAWNSAAALFAKIQPAIATPSDVCVRIASTVKHFLLVEDGMYGPKTATAFYYIFGKPRPPCRASGMAAWYVSAQDKVEALTPPTSYPVDVQEPVAAGATQQTANVVTDVEIAQAGGTTAAQREQAAVTVPGATQAGGGEVTNEAIAHSGELVTQVVSEEVPETRHIDISAQSELSFEDTPVLARPRSGRTVAIALAVGGVTLAGVLGYFAYKRRR